MKEYLGDGVYVEYNGYAIVLTADGSYGTNNTIVLEPDVYFALLKYVEKLKEVKP